MTEPTTMHRVRRIGVIGVLLPLVAASLLIWSATGRESNIDRVPVAIVNNDVIITGSQPMAAGRSLTAALTHPAAPTKNLQWTLTDQTAAATGLRDGAYYAVLTIPSDFSKSILSSGTDAPVQGRLSLVSNAAASSTVPYLSQQITAAAASALGNQVTQGYLGNVYDGFNQIAQSNQHAASSAAQLAGGTDQLSQGAGQLDQGTASLSGGLDQVAAGASQLAAGTTSLHAGAVDVQHGVADVATGARRLHDGQVALAAGTRTLATRSRVLAAQAVRVTAGTVAVAVGVRGLQTGSRLLSTQLAGLSAVCVSQGGSSGFCARLALAQAGSGRLATAAGRLAGAARTVAAGSRQITGGAAELARRNRQVADRARALSLASGTLSSSTDRLLSGATSVSQGSANVDAAAHRLVSGTNQTAQAGSSLASGSKTLASSAGETNDGAQSLSSGLAKGAKQSPTYSDAQQKALTPVVSQPVQLTSQVQYSSHGNGWLIAVIVAVILWLAALVTAVSRDLSGVLRNALAPVSSQRLALAQSLPALGLGLLQAVAVVVALVVFHPRTAGLGGMVLLTLLAGIAFALLALALRLALNRVGITIFVLFLILQLAASDNVIPLETAPGVLQKLNAVMPLTSFTNGASQLVTGGHTTSLLSVTLVLLVWAAAAWGLIVGAVKRSRARPETSSARTLSPA